MTVGQFFLVVPEVSNPVGAWLCAARDVPFNGHVAPTTKSFGPVKPGRQPKNAVSKKAHFSFVLISQELTKWNEVNALQLRIF